MAGLFSSVFSFASDYSTDSLKKPRVDEKALRVKRTGEKKLEPNLNGKGVSGV